MVSAVGFAALERRLRDVGHTDGGTLGGERLRDGTTEPGARARHDRDPAVELTHAVLPYNASP